MITHSSSLLTTSFSRDINTYSPDKKLLIWKRILDVLEDLGLVIENDDPTRDWGGVIRTSDDQARQFLTLFFRGTTLEEHTGRVSTQILLIAPGGRLSWHYHQRRSEYWRVLHGPVGAIMRQPNAHSHIAHRLQKDDTLALPKETRHLLFGLSHSWALIAEAWIHSDLNHKSEENDIVRIEPIPPLK